MQVPQRIVKPFASALKIAYNNAIRIREQVERLLVYISHKEVHVSEWTENLLGKAASMYPGHDVSSYPVQTRMQWDFDSLENYRGGLEKYLSQYSICLQEIEHIINHIVEETSSGLHYGQTVPWPKQPQELTDDPWPSHWPPYVSSLASEAQNRVAYSFNMNVSLPPRRQPSPTTFTLIIGDEEVELQARYKDGIKPFILALGDFLKGDMSFRETAIIEAMRCGIHWSKLDDYFYEWDTPWFRDKYFSMNNTFARRDEMADILSHISPESGCWYLQNKTSMHVLPVGLNNQIIEELIAADLVKWGPSIVHGEILRHLPFTKVRLLFALAALSIPNGFDTAVERYNELVISYGEGTLNQKINACIDSSRLIEFKDFECWTIEDSAAPRICAEMLLKVLFLVYECDEGPLKQSWHRNWNCNYIAGKTRSRPTGFYQIK